MSKPFLSFSCFCAMARTSRTLLNNRGESRHSGGFHQFGHLEFSLEEEVPGPSKPRKTRSWLRNLNPSPQHSLGEPSCPALGRPKSGPATRFGAGHRSERGARVGRWIPFRRGPEVRRGCCTPGSTPRPHQLLPSTLQGASAPSEAGPAGRAGSLAPGRRLGELSSVPGWNSGCGRPLAPGDPGLPSPFGGRRPKRSGASRAAADARRGWRSGR